MSSRAYFWVSTLWVTLLCGCHRYPIFTPTWMREIHRLLVQMYHRSTRGTELLHLPGTWRSVSLLTTNCFEFFHTKISIATASLSSVIFILVMMMTTTMMMMMIRKRRSSKETDKSPVQWWFIERLRHSSPSPRTSPRQRKRRGASAWERGSGGRSAESPRHSG